MALKRPGNSPGAAGNITPRSKRIQAPRACQRCKTLRRGCSESRPCQRCINAGFRNECISSSSAASATQYLPAMVHAGSSAADTVKSMSELVPNSVIDYCVERFFNRLYPTIPILTPEYVARLKDAVATRAEHEVESYCVLVAMCAQVLLQTEEAEQAFPQGTVVQKNGMYGQMILDTSLAAYQLIPRNVKPTLEQCLFAFFLYACQARLSHHSQTFLFLREATTLLNLLTFEEVDASSRAIARNLFWVLLVSERSHAIRYRRPISLQVTADTPQLDTSDVSLVGFHSLAALFRPIDTIFVALLNGEIVATPPSPDAIDRVETAVNTALNPMAGLHGTQKANLRITQLWLRVIIWKLRLRLGYLSETTHHHSLSYRYPLEVAKELTLSTRDLSIENMKVHGVGLTEKLYDVASAAVDVLSGVPMAPSSPQGLTMSTSSQEDLIFIRHLITHLPSGTSTYDPLLENQIQQALPRVGQSPEDGTPSTHIA